MDIAEVKKNLKSKRLVLGTDVTLRQVKLGKVSKVFIASNCDEATKESLERFCAMSSCTLESLDVSSDELGVLCKKPFHVSVVGLLKQ